MNSKIRLIVNTSWYSVLNKLRQNVTVVGGPKAPFKTQSTHCPLLLDSNYRLLRKPGDKVKHILLERNGKIIGSKNAQK